MKKKVISLMLSVAMLTTAFGNFVPFTTAVAAGGNMTITASQDAYVQGGSQVNYTKGTDDKNSLSARDWSDKAGAPSAYMLPYMQFELPSANDFEDIDDIKGIKLKVFCLSGKNDRYIVGLSAFESFERAAGLRLKRPPIKKKSRPRRTAFEDTEIKCRKCPEQ